MKKLISGKVSILVLTVVMAALAFFFGSNIAPISAGDKVYVCKYVGTPGVNERLQTGQNPIEVSINAVPGAWSVGAYFNDAQGRSYVLGLVPQNPKPDINDCPQGDNPTPTPTPTPSISPTPAPQCKHENAECSINDSQKMCCEGLTCMIDDNPSGNGHCEKSSEEPTPTPTPTPTSTVEPTPTSSSNSSSSGNDGGDGLGCATHDCSGNVIPQGQVLGASTMAGTGSFNSMLYQAIMGLGGIITSFGLKKALHKNK